MADQAVDSTVAMTQQLAKQNSLLKDFIAGTLDCIRKTVAKDGFKGLYRGMAAPIVGVTPMYALCFFGYGVGKKIFCKDDTFQDLNNDSLLRIAAAGATSGIFTTPILAPGERLKCSLQVQTVDPVTGKPKYAGSIDCAKQLYKEGGLRSVNRGFCATMLRDSVASAFYFSTYEVLKQYFTQPGETKPGVGGTLLAGGCAGMLNWAAALPVDTLKSKLQTAPEGKYPHGIRSVFVHLVKTEGITSLYRGFAPVMLRAFPANAACFLGFETAVKALDYLGVP